jgi:hypothetical protein
LGFQKARQRDSEAASSAQNPDLLRGVIEDPVSEVGNSDVDIRTVVVFHP